MDFRACLKTGMKNEILRLKFGEPGGTLPPRIPRSTPSPGSNIILDHACDHELPTNCLRPLGILT